MQYNYKLEPNACPKVVSSSSFSSSTASNNIIDRDFACGLTFYRGTDGTLMPCGQHCTWQRQLFNCCGN